MRTNRSVALAVTAIGCAVALSLQGTQAAFTATTSTVGDFTAGSVTIRDDDSAAAMFDVQALEPGQNDRKCLIVTYEGDLANEVRLRASLTETDGGSPVVPANALLDSHLNVLIEYDTVTTANFANCGDFTSEGTLFNDTLANLVATHTTFANGKTLGTAAGAAWTPVTNETRVFMITYTLSATAPDTVQGDRAVATFTWEAQNT